MHNNTDNFVNASGFRSDSDDEDYMANADTAPLLEALQCGLTENLSDLERVVTILSTTLPLLCQSKYFFVLIFRLFIDVSTYGGTRV
jgi:hypothetical protein